MMVNGDVKKNQEEWLKNVRKKARNSSAVKNIIKSITVCNHNGEFRICGAALLSNEDKRSMVILILI